MRENYEVIDEAISGSLTRLPRRCYASPRNDKAKKQQKMLN
ncbi:MAG: hypothetical protein ACRYE8_00680 [Janthinobacterium lividum]